MSNFKYLKNTAASAVADFEEFLRATAAASAEATEAASTLGPSELLPELDAIDQTCGILDMARDSAIGTAREIRAMTQRLLDLLPPIAAIGITGEGDKSVTGIYLGRTLPMRQVLGDVLSTNIPEGTPAHLSGETFRQAVLAAGGFVPKSAAQEAIAEWQPRLTRLGATRALVVTDLDRDLLGFGRFRRSEFLERVPFSKPEIPTGFRRGKKRDRREERQTAKLHPHLWQKRPKGKERRQLPSFRVRRFSNSIDLTAPSPNLAYVTPVFAKLAAWSFSYAHLERGTLLLLPTSAVKQSLLA